VNIGNPQEVTIEDLARRVIAVTEANVGLRYIPYESAYEAGFEDMERRVPDIRKLKEITGFAPTVGLDEALLRTLVWFRAQPRAGEAALRAVC
jgi:UDP-glucose 4-epimerase